MHLVNYNDHQRNETACSHQSSARACRFGSTFCVTQLLNVTVIAFSKQRRAPSGSTVGQHTQVMHEITRSCQQSVTMPVNAYVLNTPVHCAVRSQVCKSDALQTTSTKRSIITHSIQ
eukprot:13516-Heterococcus_DN1.PRE.3